MKLLGIILAAATAMLPCAAEQCVPISVGEPVDKERIVRGQDAPIAEWPSFASISLRRTGGPYNAIHFCGGTAISERWVLTAAHCVHGAAANATFFPRVRHSLNLGNQVFEGRLFATLGTNDLSEGQGAEVFPIVSFVVHPGYDPVTGDDDIALLMLDRPWTGPVSRLGLTGDHTDIEGRAFIAGFGFQRDPRENYAPGRLNSYLRAGTGERYLAPVNILKAALVPPISDNLCRARNPGLIDVDTEFCAGFRSGSRDACNADSGGPIVQIDQAGCPYQVGLVQSGRWCGREAGADSNFGVYTRVSAYATFIQNTIGQVASPLAPPETNYEAMMATKRKMQRWGDLMPDTLGMSMHRIPSARSQALPRPEHPNGYWDGDEAYIQFEARIPGRLVIFDMAPDGRLSKLYPAGRAFEDIQGASAGAPSGGRLPPTGSFFTRPPFGTGSLVAILSPPWAEMDLRDITLQRADDPSSHILDELTMALEDVRNSPEFDGWGMAFVEYKIDPAPN